MNRKEFTKEQKERMETCFKEFLSIVDDPSRPGLLETPKRMVKYWTELLEGQLYTNEEIAEMYDKCFDLDEGDVEVNESTGVKQDLVIETNIPIFSHCFTYNTRILTPDGNHKLISKFKVGDMVRTFNKETGKLEDHRVTYVHKNKSNDWYRIRVNNASTTVTGNHPYFKEDGTLVEARDLHVGDLVWGLRMPFINSPNRIPIKCFNKDYNLGYILGTLLSDGCINHNNLKLQCTEKFFADKFASAIEGCFGIKPIIRIYHNHGFKDDVKMYNVHIINSQICDILEELCEGHYRCKDFKLPRIIFDDFEIFKGFFEAYLDGDGSEYTSDDGKVKMNHISSSNGDFIKEVARIFDRTYYEEEREYCNMFTTSLPLFFNQRDSKKGYYEKFYKKFNQQLKNEVPTIIYEDMKLYPVTEHEALPKYTKDAYNLEVEGNHSYIANNVWVHNCEHHGALMYDMFVTIAYIPNSKVIGLSKMGRIAEMVGKRLQLQEKIGEDIAEVMSIILGTNDVAVIIEGKHGCMTARGVKSREAVTRTACLNGLFRTNNSLRSELYSLISKNH